MKMKKLSMIVLTVFVCAVSTTGCARALRDGVSIGVTDGLSDGIAVLVSNFIGSISGSGG